MTSAIAQLRPKSLESSDPLWLVAAVEAFPESLAVIKSGVVVYVNPAWCGMFECPDPLQLYGRRVEELIPAHFLSRRHGTERNDQRENCEAQLVHTRRDGTRQHIELARARLPLPGAEFQMVHARDVSRQK